MATTSYNINYDDEKFQQVESEKQTALDNVNSTYNQMINQSDQYYQDQINASKEWAGQQQQLQQEQTDHLVSTIEQQKAQAEKDYTKEQKGAYVDWQKQSNQYGTNAEAMASQGLTNTGFGESSQTSMYNQYQGRVVSAREVYNRAVLNYDNSIKEAQLTNNSKLAEIAYQALQTQLQLSLEGFQYKNQLLQTQIQQQQATEDRYYSRWQDVLGQMNQENQFAESIRQYEKNYELQTKQFEEQVRQYEQSYAQQIKEFDEGIRQFDEQMKYYREKDAQEYQYKIQQLELQKQELEQRKKEAEQDYQLKVAQLNESKRQYNQSYATQNSSYNLNNGGGSGTQIKTQYYSGAINPDTQYGTFSTTDVNGVKYQPNNVGGKKLSSVKEGNTTLTIENNGVTQKIWTTGDGNYYYWEGRENKYKPISQGKIEAIKTLIWVNSRNK